MVKQTQWDRLHISEGPKLLQQAIESLQSHLGETKIPVGETEVTRVSGSGYVKWTRWRRMDQFGGAEFDFWFGTYVDMKVIEGFWSISLSILSKQDIKQNLIPF